MLVELTRRRAVEERDLKRAFVCARSSNSFSNRGRSPESKRANASEKAAAESNGGASTSSRARAIV